MQGAQGQDLFSACVSDLVLESREFEMLLGQIQSDGTRKPGCLDKFQKDSSAIISFVASEAEGRGLYEDAVRLYDLAGKETNVVQLLNKLLSQLASAPSSAHSDRDRLQMLAIGIAERYMYII